jgi:hypothetical protein
MIATNIGLDISQGYAALFDQIENDDDGGLQWEEFERFFENILEIEIVTTAFDVVTAVHGQVFLCAGMDFQIAISLSTDDISRQLIQHDIHFQQWRGTQVHVYDQVGT